MASILMRSRNCIVNLASHQLLNSRNILSPTTVRSLGSIINKGDDNALQKKHDWEVIDKITHTGQSFSSDDKRLARFIGKEKQINERFAIDLIAETPPKASKERVVCCDGGGGPLGHPKVFINLDDPGNHACGYCGLRFYKEDSHGH